MLFLRRTRAFSRALRSASGRRRRSVPSRKSVGAAASDSKLLRPWNSPAEPLCGAVYLVRGLPQVRTMRYALLGSFVFASALMLHPAAHAEGATARASMERCVERVLSGLAKAKAPESELRNAVLSGCDGPLRATLSEAMKSGEARMCASFEACIDIARKQTAEEAKEAYRARLGR